MKHHVVVFILCLISPFTSASESEQRIVYTDEFADYYAVIVDRQCSIDPDLPVRHEEQSHSRLAIWHALLRQTDGVLVPYDRAVACLSFSGPKGAQCNILLRRFRTIQLHWINDRLVGIEVNIGHAASVFQVLDLERKQWIYQLGESYPMDAEPDVTPP